MSGITLSSAMRTNLLSLQSNVKHQSITQKRLSTGREINEAIDSPYRYFTSNLLQSRADDLDTLNNDLNLSAKTIQAATKGIEAMLTTLDQARALLSQAHQESDGFQRRTYLNQYNEALKQFENLAEDSGYKGKNLLGGAGNDMKVIFNEEYTSQMLVEAVDFTDVRNVGLNKNMSQGIAGTSTVMISADAGGTAQSITPSTKMVDILGYKEGDVIEFAGLKQGEVYGSIEIMDSMTVDEFMTMVSVSVDNVEAKLSANTGSIDFTYATEIAIRHVKEPNSLMDGNEVNHALGGVTDKTLGGTFTGHLSPGADLVEVMSDISSGATIDIAVDDINGDTRTTTFTYGVDGTTVQDFLEYMNDNADNIQLTLDFDGTDTQIKVMTSSMVGNGAGEIALTGSGVTLAAPFGAADTAGTAIASAALVTESDFFSDSQVESLLLRVRAAEINIRQQMTSFSTDLSMIQGRIDFSEMMVNVLELGATDLVIADLNEESANLLALQTRQSLSTQALSMASQAEQSVLNLFR